MYFFQTYKYPKSKLKNQSSLPCLRTQYNIWYESLTGDSANNEKQAGFFPSVLRFESLGRNTSCKQRGVGVEREFLLFPLVFYQKHGISQHREMLIPFCSCANLSFSRTGSCHIMKQLVNQRGCAITECRRSRKQKLCFFPTIFKACFSMLLSI